MHLNDLYQHRLQQLNYCSDAAQLNVVAQLQKIYDLLVEQETENKNIFQRIKISFTAKYIPGLYLWGSVGVGKTFLMDLFYQALPIKRKLRLHFHQFMQQVHAQLTELQGTKNPFATIAKRFASKAAVICFDELMVVDIADAMILAGLFKAILQEDITLIFTSNVAPDDLYKNGLQRQNFMPAIKLIKEHCSEFHLQTITDYRWQFLPEAKFYWSPINVETEGYMLNAFEYFSVQAQSNATALIIYNRSIQIKAQANGVLWVDFLDICGIPRSQDDYLVISELFHTVLLDNLEQIKSRQHDLARAFIELVDVFYDAKIRLIIAATVPINEIYPEGLLSFEFARTRSRLIEMQSLTWAQQKPLPEPIAL